MFSMTPAPLRTITRKLRKLQTDPVGILSHRVKAGRNRVHRWTRTLRRELIFRRPIYDVCHWLMNRAATRAYANGKGLPDVSALQQRVVDELKTRGISLVHFNDLFPDKKFSDLQELGERLLQRPGNQDRIRAIEGGAIPVDVSKFYLVRLVGRPPVFDHDDRFVELALSDGILGIVGAYLGMFSRVVGMDLWCNVPTGGPDRYSQSWHRDPEDKRLVKIFLYLRDVDRGAGPFFYIPGSHNDGPLGNLYPQTMPDSLYPASGEVEKRVAESQILTCTGRAGTLIFCDTTGLHKGGHPRSNLRVLFTAEYASNAAFLDPDNRDRYVIRGLRKDRLGPAAKYGISRVRAT
jgi:hypothetical protein